MELEKGKLVAGRWRIVTELYSEDFPRYRVTDADGLVAEMLILDDIQTIQEYWQDSKQVEHENLVRLYEVGNWLGLNYYVRELIAMETLSEWYQRQKPVEEEQAVGIACQLALIMQKLEKVQMRRCSFNPDIVYVTGNGIVKVDPLQQFFYKNNKDRFAAPKESESEVTDQRSDVYRIGMIAAWLLLQGRFDNDLRQIRQYLYSASDSELISPALLGILGKMTAESPGERPMAGEEVLDELDKVLAISSHRVVFGDEKIETKWFEDKRFWLYTSLFLFIVVIVLLLLQEVFN